MRPSGRRATRTYTPTFPLPWTGARNRNREGGGVGLYGPNPVTPSLTTTDETLLLTSSYPPHTRTSMSINGSRIFLITATSGGAKKLDLYVDLRPQTNRTAARREWGGGRGAEESYTATESKAASKRRGQLHARDAFFLPRSPSKSSQV